MKLNECGPWVASVVLSILFVLMIWVLGCFVEALGLKLVDVHMPLYCRTLVGVWWTCFVVSLRIWKPKNCRKFSALIFLYSESFGMYRSRAGFCLDWVFWRVGMAVFYRIVSWLLAWVMNWFSVIEKTQKNGVKLQASLLWCFLDCCCPVSCCGCSFDVEFYCWME